jgi:hypothetical protein
MSNPTIIRVPGEPGPRGPRGFPFLIKGTLNDPSELSGAYLVFDGEDEVIEEGLQPGDVGYEEPVIASAFLIGENIWVFDDQELWINAGAIRPTITVDEVNVLNPDQNPNIVNVGTDADAIFVFDLPRAPSFSVGTVEAGNDAQDVDVVDVGENGDVELNIRLPRVTVDVGDTNAIDPNQNPSVTNAGTNEAVEFEFNIPRAREVSVGEVTQTNPDQAPSVTSTELSDGDVEFDFALPRAAQFSVAETSVVNPDQSPNVEITDSSDGDVEITFDLPRAPSFSVGSVVTVDDTDPAVVTDVGENGDVVLDFEIPAGRIGIRFRGPWSSSTEYEERDVVVYRDASDDTESAYIALSNHTNQAPPATEDAPSAFWAILAKGGSDGAGAPSTATPLTVTAATQTGVIGISEQFARADHVHPSESFLPGNATISDLSNVSAPSPEPGASLVFNSQLGEWGAEVLPSPITEIGGLDDVDTEFAEEGSLLFFDGEDSQWVARLPDPIELNEISNVDVADPPEGSVLLYNGESWVSSFIDGGTPSSVYN